MHLTTPEITLIGMASVMVVCVLIIIVAAAKRWAPVAVALVAVSSGIVGSLPFLLNQ